MKLSLSFLFFIFCSFCFAQYRQVLKNDTADYKVFPPVILKTFNGSEHYTRFYLINPAYINRKSYMYNSVINHMQFDSVEIVELAKDRKLLDVVELLNKYHVNPKYNTLPIYIDSTLVNNSSSVYFEPSAVKTVKVQRQKNTGAKYINVASIFHTDNPYSDVYLFGTYNKRE